jgi:hypothetical protein
MGNGCREALSALFALPIYLRLAPAEALPLRSSLPLVLVVLDGAPLEHLEDGGELALERPARTLGPAGATPPVPWGRWSANQIVPTGVSSEDRREPPGDPARRR